MYTANSNGLLGAFFRIIRRTRRKDRLSTAIAEVEAYHVNNQFQIASFVKHFSRPGATLPVPFVGAGLSMPLLKGWTEFLTRLAADNNLTGTILPLLSCEQYEE